ncbi:MAG TPA: serine hydrolase domain-containing protein [Acidimicrobiales bacterium]|nr:serine hydrolase domain-containing protein [Acidimicrobiales bacterium]
MSGSALCVFGDGKVADIEYRGSRCHTGGRVDEATIWEAASLSKPLLAAHALRLAAAGEIDLDENLKVDLASIGARPDRRWQSLTARRLLTHTSGLPNWRGPLTALAVGGADVDSQEEALDFAGEPGDFCYSGEGFGVLLHCLAARAGVAAPEVLQSLLAWSAMTESSFVWQPRYEGAAAAPHLADGRALPKRHPSVGHPAGTLHTTLADYAGFASAVLSEGADEIFVPCFDLGEGRGRALGWATTDTPSGVLAWQHGDNMGFKHIVALRRHKADGVLMFTNIDSGADDYRAVCRSVLGAEPF